MHYFIDGYNLLFRIIHSDDELQKQRDYLLKDLTVKLDFVALDATIVFDAAFSPGEATRTRKHHVDIIYTAAGESADNFILNELSGITRPYQETVVTSDKKLAALVRRLGAKTLDIDPFIVWLESRYRNKVSKLRKQDPKPERPRAPPKVIVPAAIPEATPKAAQTPEACYDYYIHAFEKRLKEQPPLETPRKSPAKAQPKRKKNSPEPEIEELIILSDEERYLRLFTKRAMDLMDDGK